MCGLVLVLSLSDKLVLVAVAYPKNAKKKTHSENAASRAGLKTDAKKPRKKGKKKPILKESKPKKNPKKNPKKTQKKTNLCFAFLKCVFLGF